MHPPLEVVALTLIVAVLEVLLEYFTCVMRHYLLRSLILSLESFHIVNQLLFFLLFIRKITNDSVLLFILLLELLVKLITFPVFEDHGFLAEI